MVCFISLRCPGAELRIRRKYSKLAMKLTVLVKDINDTKIALSLKFPETNPWANAAEDYAVGNS